MYFIKYYSVTFSEISGSLRYVSTGLREKGSQCQSKTFPKTFFVLEVFSIYLPHARKIFSTPTVNVFSF